MECFVSEQSEKPSFWRKMIDAYQQLCKDMGVDQGGCRSCVPKYHFDENGKRVETSLPQMHSVPEDTRDQKKGN